MRLRWLLITFAIGSAIALGAIVACSGFSSTDEAEAAPDAKADAAVEERPIETASDAALDAPDALDALDATDASPPLPPSCVGLPAVCGAVGAEKGCCTVQPVPAGQVLRSNDDASVPAVVSAFKLDVYEVTVARFRKFVLAGKGTQSSAPAPGDGANPNLASSGWQASFSSQLAATTGDLRTALLCSVFPTWTDNITGDEKRPINCVTWYEAFAFCAWDGGRLPTEAEWNYAAAGGALQRNYPWGEGIDPTKASYECRGNGTDAGLCELSDILVVGRRTSGNGRWGQADLAGNVGEWVLDAFASPYLPGPCQDCADLDGGADGGAERVVRGGEFQNAASTLQTWVRPRALPTARYQGAGVRCARN